MDIKDFKNTFLQSLKNDTNFRHSVLNILSEDLSTILSLSTSSDFETNLLKSVDIEINQIPTSKTKKDVNFEKTSEVLKSIIVFFELFKSKKITKKRQCEKMYIKFLNSINSNNDIDDCNKNISNFLNETKDFIGMNENLNTYDYLVICLKKHNIDF